VLILLDTMNRPRFVSALGLLGAGFAHPTRLTSRLKRGCCSIEFSECADIAVNGALEPSAGS
jgi:hypothetical protein